MLILYVLTVITIAFFSLGAVAQNLRVSFLSKTLFFLVFILVMELLPNRLVADVIKYDFFSVVVILSLFSIRNKNATTMMGAIIIPSMFFMILYQQPNENLAIGPIFSAVIIFTWALSKLLIFFICYIKADKKGKVLFESIFPLIMYQNLNLQEELAPLLMSLPVSLGQSKIISFTVLLYLGTIIIFQVGESRERFYIQINFLFSLVIFFSLLNIYNAKEWFLFFPLLLVGFALSCPEASGSKGLKASLRPISIFLILYGLHAYALKGLSDYLAYITFVMGEQYTIFVTATLIVILTFTLYRFVVSLLSGHDPEIEKNEINGELSR